MSNLIGKRFCRTTTDEHEILSVRKGTVIICNYKLSVSWYGLILILWCKKNKSNLHRPLLSVYESKIKFSPGEKRKNPRIKHKEFVCKCITIFYNYILYVFLYGLILMACAWFYSANVFYVVLVYSKLGTFEIKFLSLSWNDINRVFSPNRATRFVEGFVGRFFWRYNRYLSCNQLRNVFDFHS